MPDDQELYTLLFNAVTDALMQLDAQNFGLAAETLRRAQCEAEERYIVSGDSSCIFP